MKRWSFENATEVTALTWPLITDTHLLLFKSHTFQWRTGKTLYNTQYIITQQHIMLNLKTLQLLQIANHILSSPMKLKCKSKLGPNELIT